MRRFLNVFGVALAALVFSAQMAAAQLVIAPAYKTLGGQVQQSIGIVCLNPDASSCTFGGGGSISANASASPTAVSAGPAALNMGLFSNLFVTIVDSSGSPVNFSTTSPVQLVAGEAHAGEVGGNALPIIVPQTVTASSAYTSGNAIGGLMTLANAVRVSGTLGAPGTTGMFQDLTVNFKSTQTAEVDVVLFKANPTGSTCTDKTAFSLAVADFDKVIDVVPITVYATSLGTPSVASARNISRTFGIASGTSAYACAITRGTPTFTATTDVSLTFGIIRN